MNWNSSQKKAIEERNKNILVSAAAGSGKTAVLVERIRRIIIDEEVPIDKFLIVTFTNAAASEMKEKIVKALTQAAETADDRKLGYIREQLSMASNANISTFHGFALEILRRYFYLINLEPGFSVCDSDQAAVMKIKAVDTVFEKHFEENDADFLKFITKYGSDRNEKGAKNIVTSLYTMVMSIPDPFIWLDEMTEKLDMKKEDFIESSVWKLMLDDTGKALEEAKETVNLLIDFFNEGGVSGMADKYRAYFEKFPEDYTNYDEIKAFLDMRVPSFTAKKDEKEFLAAIKEEAGEIRDEGFSEMKEVRKAYFESDIDEMLEDIRDTYESARCLSDLVKEFHMEFRRLKAEKNLIDFNDIEHFALEILAVEPRVSQEYKDKFRYIFIDEYQDTNDVQEKLISYIKREDNLFMVGDVKQSIYKFRLAEPEIFMKKYDDYSRGTDENSIKIDFNENYRSKGGIINAVNDIFINNMIGYDEESRLNKGIAYSGELEFPVTLVVNDDHIDDDMKIIDEINELRQEEIEAKIAVETVKEALGSTFYDIKQEKERTVDYRDIVVLMRSTKGTAGIYGKEFEAAGIPVYLDESEGYFDTIEVEMIENILRVVDNFRQDIPLIALLYSPVMNFSCDDLMDIKLGSSEKYFYKSFENYAKKGNDENLRIKCNDALKKIESWRDLSQSMDIADFIWSVIWETGYYTYAGALPGGRQRQANLKALADKALKLSSMGIKDLYGMLGYIDSMKGKKISVGQVSTSSEDDNVVRIMTVHKSKGLEFPVVIAAGSGKKYNLKTDSKHFAAHKKIGFALSSVDKERYSFRKTALQNLINRTVKNESLEEEKRILYVEYTRAMDKLYILGSSKDFEKEREKAERSKSSRARAPLEYVLPAFLKEDMQCKVITRDKLSLESERAHDMRKEIGRILDRSVCDSEEVARRLSYEYPFEAETDMKYKYSVSELAGEDHMDNIELKKPSFAMEDRKLSKAQKGTITHKVMELIDFNNDMEDEIRLMVNKNIISEEESGEVNVEGIKGFAESSLGRRAVLSEMMKREQPFTMMMEKQGVPVMVQGIIDCFFEEDGEIVLIDYKNTDITDDNILKERYMEQIGLYTQALENSLGKKVKERYLYILTQNRSIEM